MAPPKKIYEINVILPQTKQGYKNPGENIQP